MFAMMKQHVTHFLALLLLCQYFSALCQVSRDENKNGSSGWKHDSSNETAFNSSNELDTNDTDVTTEGLTFFQLFPIVCRSSEAYDKVRRRCVPVITFDGPIWARRRR